MKSKFLTLAVSTVILAGYSCKKQTTFTYKAECISCKISYFDENGAFVSREDHQGAFEKQISVNDFAEVMIAVQSTFAIDSAAGNPIFQQDKISVELQEKGNVVCSHESSNGKKLQAVSCSFGWENKFGDE